METHNEKKTPVLTDATSKVMYPNVMEFERALVTLDRVNAQRIFLDAEPASDPAARIEGLIVPALERIGQGWEAGIVSLSQVYMAGRLCETLVDSILPPADPGRRKNPPLAIAVIEDYHLLGLRIIYSALRASGFELRNYGRVTMNELLARVAEDRIAVLLLSALMLPSALRIKEVTSRLRSVGQATKIIVGGAPFRFDPALAAEVGADAVGDSGSDAVSLVRRFLEVAP
jgi:methanogenic corrinoid protein MtbC1